MRHSSERLALLRKLLAEKGIAGDAGTGIPRRAEEEPAPLSFGQLRLWFLEQLEPGTSLYNDSLCTSLSGRELDEDLFEEGLQAVVARHAVLRTSFGTEDGQPVQRIHAEGSIPLRRVDLRSLGEGERAAEVERLLLEDVRGPFDLERLPLARATLVRRADDAWEFGLTMHHIVSDGVSYAVLWRELAEVYRARREGRVPELPDLPIQFADYAAWERATVGEERIREGVEFWVRELGRERPPLELPFDFPRPAEARHRGAFHRFAFPAGLVRALRELCRREGVTSNHVLVAAYLVLLHSYSGQEDLLVGMPSSSRTRKELEGLVGFFVQTLLQRYDLSGDPTFRELVERTRDRSLRTSAYEDVPFDRVVQALRSGTAPEETPWIQAWIAPMKDLMPPLRLPGLRASYRIVDPRNARFDLCLILDETSEGISAYFEYDVDLFAPARVASMAERYLALLGLALPHPDTRLSLLRETLARQTPEPGAAGAAPREGAKRIRKTRRRVAEG